MLNVSLVFLGALGPRQNGFALRGQEPKTTTRTTTRSVVFLSSFASLLSCVSFFFRFTFLLLFLLYLPHLLSFLFLFFCSLSFSCTHFAFLFYSCFSSNFTKGEGKKASAWQGFAQREANNPKRQERQQGLLYFSSFASLLCCVSLFLRFTFLLLFLLYFPDAKQMKEKQKRKENNIKNNKADK